MTRIPALALLAAAVLTGCDVFGPSDRYDYNVVLPDDYESTTKTYPLIFFLHGAGGVENHEQRFREASGSDPFIIAVLDAKDVGWRTSLLAKTLDELKQKYRVDEERIYGTGLSSGAYAMWHFAANRPAEFAALVLVAGWGSDEIACVLRHVPVWLVHNRDDPVVPHTESQELRDAIAACPGLVRFTLNATPPPNVHPHNAWSATYSSAFFYQWLLRHKRGAPGAVD